MNLALAPGSRCLLIGANGAGKTTLLKILGGKHMIPREQVRAVADSWCGVVWCGVVWCGVVCHRQMVRLPLPV
jgi:ABC-type branched-subunit amino acid transport system ATPase component